MAIGIGNQCQWPLVNLAIGQMAIPIGQLRRLNRFNSIGQEVKPIPMVKRPGLIYQSKYNHPVWPM